MFIKDRHHSDCQDKYDCYPPVPCLKKGLHCYPLLWKGVYEKLFVKLMDQCAPNSKKIISLIRYNMSEEPPLCKLEERVKGYKSTIKGKIINIFAFLDIFRHTMYEIFRSCFKLI